MQTESIELSFLSLFTFITFFIFLIVSKYSHKLNQGILLDKDFLKPQAFHNEAVSRSGGTASVISLLILTGIYYLLYSKILYEYIILSSSLFLIGYLLNRDFVASLVLAIIFTVTFNIAPLVALNVSVPSTGCGLPAG